MKKHTLSKKSIELLEDHGYKVRIGNHAITIKKRYDYIGPIILFFLYALVALPLFNYSFWLGSLIFMLLVLGVYLHRNLLSKASTLKFSIPDSRIDIKSRRDSRWFTYWYVNNLFISSKFKSEYTSAFKNTSEEYLVVIGAELKSGEVVDFIHLLSDYKEPNEQMNEVYHFIEGVLKKE
ncbi:MAG: hypothetical protein AAF391_05130 [Bacteroidota bacterium]